MRQIARLRTLCRILDPQNYPRALLEGFEWDFANRRYDTLSQLTGYAVRVAGSVGAMMGMLMGVRDPTRWLAPAIWASPCN